MWNTNEEKRRKKNKNTAETALKTGKKTGWRWEPTPIGPGAREKKKSASG